MKEQNDFFNCNEHKNDCNCKMNLNDGTLTPGIDFSPNMRLNLSNGDLEFGMNIGNMWMKF